MMSLYFVAALLCACASHQGLGTRVSSDSQADAAAAVADPQRAPIGVQIQQLPEGLLITSVSPGSGAQLAGLEPGQLIVSVDDVATRDAPQAATFSIRGPTGSSVELILRQPWSGDYGAVMVTRGGAQPKAAKVARLPGSVLGLRSALMRRGSRAVRRATRLAVLDGFGGMAPADALTSTLRRAAQRRPSAARAAVELLVGLDPRDDRLRFKLGEASFLVGDWQLAAQELASSEGQRPRDGWDPAGSWVADGGGNPRGRSMLAQALLQLGQRDPATHLARELLRSTRDLELQEQLRMAELRPSRPWRVALPPLDDLIVRTLTGQRWRLEDHRGQPVILTFFATWCGPCRRELPELAALWDRRHDQGLQVLAVSTDGAESADDLPEFVDDLGLPFPVAHSPSVAQRFGVSGIPAVTVIDGAGVPIYSSSGYSLGGVSRIKDVVDGAIEAAAGEGPAGSTAKGAGRVALGDAWSALDADLVGFVAVKGARGLVTAAQTEVVGRAGRPPLLVGARKTRPGRGPDADSDSGQLLAWLDGPVVANLGGRWLRALGASGRSRWLVTTSAPVRSMVGSDDRLWVASADELVIVDSVGRVLRRQAGGATELAADGAGGVYAVDGNTWRHLSAAGEILAEKPAVGAVHVDERGRVSSRVFSDLTTGRFGPDGAWRTVLARGDGVVVGLSGDGQAAFTWELQDAAQVAHVDGDGDGQDELLVSVRGQGLATVALRLP